MSHSLYQVASVIAGVKSAAGDLLFVNRVKLAHLAQ
jgi:hypothetical protein